MIARGLLTFMSGTKGPRVITPNTSITILTQIQLGQCW